MTTRGGRTAIVHGAAEPTGGAFATRLAADGAYCVLVDVDPCGLEAVAGRIRDLGGTVETAVLDPVDVAGVRDHTADVAARGGGVDIVVAPFSDVVVRTVAPFVRETSGVIVIIHNGEGDTPTMQFALIYHYDPTVASPAEEEVQAWMDLDAALSAKGHTIHEAGLHGRDEARTVVVRDGTAEVSEKPTTPAASTVAGWYVVTADDIDEATALAARIPTAAYGYVEVRQVVEWSPDEG